MTEHKNGEKTWLDFFPLLCVRVVVVLLSLLLPKESVLSFRH